MTSNSLSGAPAVKVPPALRTLATRFGLDLSSWESSGRLSLRVDQHPRVSLRQGPGTRIELEARLASLPESAAEREAMVDRLLVHAAAHAMDRHAALTLAPNEARLLLQDSLPGDEANAFADGLESFLNDLDYWTAVAGERG